MAHRRRTHPEYLRYRLFAWTMYFAVFVLIARLFYVQLIGRGQYMALAEKQHRSVVRLEPERGKIFDRNGVLMAFNLPSVTVVALADSIRDPYAVGHRLAALMRLPPAEIIAKLRTGKGWVEVARRQPPELRQKIEHARLPFVGCREELQRRYARGEDASQVIGFTRSDGTGGYGLEMAWDHLLCGKPGMAVMQRTGRARIFSSPQHAVRPAVNGADLVLTLDARYQRIAQQELSHSVAEYGAKGGSVVILKPGTGEVLAICSAPTFDANNWSNYNDSAWKLNAITDQYEPGSTFKLVALAAMLDTKFRTQDDRVFCENGEWSVFDHTIRDTKPYGMLSVRDVLVYSSNIGMAKMVQEFDRRKLYLYAESFGFGRPTGIELVGEIGGKLKSVGDWSKLTPLVFSFGHEVAVTPLQMAAMFSTIANDGVYVAPRLLLAASHDGKYGRPDIEQPVRRVISSTTAELLRDMMGDAVERGTGKQAAIDGVTVCGKTGTARVVREGIIGYAGDRYVSSFGGFFPKDNPAVTIFVVINEPRGAYYGGSVAAPCFKRIAERLISLEGLQYFTRPDRDADEPKPLKVVPNLVGLEKSDAVRVLKRNRLDVDFEGDGAVVISQAPNAGSVISEDADVQLLLGEAKAEDGAVVVPDLRNLPLRNALNLLAQAQLAAEVSGNGLVADQHPQAGKTLQPGKTVRLVCKTMF